MQADTFSLLVKTMKKYRIS